MAEEEENWNEDLEEDAAIQRLFPRLTIQKQRRGNSDHNSEVRPSNETVDFVALPCGHRMPTDYVVALFKFYLKQKETEFSCPRFTEDRGKTCGAQLSYQDICGLIPLTDKQREFLEENLAALVARRLFDFKACPGCQSHVERRDRNNLCVKCTICTANMKRTYNFCWSCRREWKGPANALRCSNNGCGQKENTPDPLKKCKPEFKREKLRNEREDFYLSKDKSPDRKRMALLINNVEFEYLNDRKGAEKDELSMETLLKGLGYTVVTLRDLTAQGMLGAMRDFAQREEHAQSDSCFVVMMSHGNAAGIAGVSKQASDDEEELFSTDEIFNCLNTPNCAGLRDKPKIILIQACRGDNEGSVDAQDSVASGNKRKEHREKDFCCLRSCTPDTVSYRCENGSHFIQSIVEIFNQHACQDHIEELFRKAKSHSLPRLTVLKKFKEMHPEQMPCKERTTLCKSFYLFPGL